MGRLRLGLSTALALALAGPAGAAEFTRLQSSEPGDPFALQFSVRWDREQLKGTIAREKPSTTGPGVVDQDELRYTRTRNDLVTRFALALYEDLELRVDIPYSMADDVSWKLASIPASSTILTSTIDAMTRPCPDLDGNGQPDPCPLFGATTSDTTVYKGGELGDVKAGVAWGVFNDQRDDTKPTWIVGVDVTFPTAKLYAPGEDRRPNMGSPHFAAANRGSAGEKVWRWDLYTALSRRFGQADPYFRAHLTRMSASADTYSNCDHVDDFHAMAVPAATFAATENCRSSSWKDEAAAKLPWVAGLTFGTELVPYENVAEEQKVTLDFRVWGDYTSDSRFYNELTDASGKLHQTENFLTMGAYFGLYLRLSRWVTLNVSSSLATRTAHYLSGEYLGKSKGDDAGASEGADISGATSNPDLNPNFDWRYDAPGNRFLINGVSVLTFSGAFVLQF